MIDRLTQQTGQARIPFEAIREECHEAHVNDDAVKTTIIEAVR